MSGYGVLTRKAKKGISTGGVYTCQSLFPGVAKNSSIIFTGYHKPPARGGAVINSCSLCSCSARPVSCVAVERWLAADREDDGWWETWSGFTTIAVWYLVLVLLNCVG